MIRKVLIANRGEIAVRIIRACRELGICTVAVFSEADRGALHAQIADEAVCVGPAASKDSYLNIHNILSVCDLTGVDAIHPGFGFLSENPVFAKMCERLGITFIGPSHQAIELMGNKAQAKLTTKKAGVPVVPGSDGVVKSPEEAREVGDQIGYPLLIKASAGGGGRGIRMVTKASEIASQFVAASTEAMNFFGDSSVYMEKFLENPRHIEVQILADQQGHVVHLGERDCSIQRRNQKMLEESPSPASVMSAELRQRMGESAIHAAKAVNYRNAGTIEFLVDATGDYYFMEMNTRIQVEHPITEQVTNIDLVKWQILIASGMDLGFTQEDIRIQGHAIECRINAENPNMGFRPSPGTITALHIPGGPGIRVDTAVYSGYTIPPYYDSMIAKLIVTGTTRYEAIMKMRWALAEFIIEGVDTNIDYQLHLLRDANFETGNYDIGFLSRKNFVL